MATPGEVHDHRSAVGGLGWLSAQSRPDLAYDTSQSQRRQNRPTLEDIRSVNKTIRTAKSTADFEHVVRPIPLEQLACVAYHDAAWSNVEDEQTLEAAGRPCEEPKLVSETTPMMDVPGPERPKHRSQAGYLLFFVDRREAAQGTVRTSTLVDWRSHCIKRVVHSTFAGEVLAAVEAMGAALCCRGVMLECLHGKDFVMGSLRTGPQSSDEMERVRQRLPILGICDCKSVYDAVARDGVLKLPTEKRLGVELASLKEIVHEEAGDVSATKLDQLPLRWVPTEHQLADCLTKAMNGQAIREAVMGGVLKISEGELGVRPLTANDETTQPVSQACVVATGIEAYVQWVTTWRCSEIP